jgi:streptogramin lyase
MRAFLASFALLSALPLATLPDGATAQLAERVAEGRRLEQAAREAAHAGSNGEYLKLIRKAAALRPHHPYLLYGLADALALAGDTAAAIDALARLAGMGIAVAPGEEPDFAPLSGRGDFQALLRRFERNADPHVGGEVAFRVEDQGFLPEGVAYDPRDGSFFVSSVHRKAIARLAPDSAPRLLPVDDVLSPMGMVLDDARGLLWVAASAVPEGSGTDSVHVGAAAVLALDPTTGERRGTWPAPQDGEPHVFGDLAVAADGSVVVSDSRTPGLYRLTSPEGTLRAVPLTEALLSPQGVTFTDGGRTVLLADYALGILRVDVKSGEVAALDYPADRTLLGVDGLYRTPSGDVVAIQNGVRPARVVRLRLAPDARAIEEVTTLEAGHPLHDDPTLGVVVGDALYYVANAQWAKFAADAAGTEPVAPPAVLRLPLAALADPGRQREIESAEELVRAMHDRYRDRWYRTLRFRQTVVRTAPDGSHPPDEVWLEHVEIPGRLRIDQAADYDGNGVIYAGDSLFVFREGALTRRVAQRNPLLVLGFDVYRQPVAQTLSVLSDEGFDLSVLRTDRWQDRPVYVVGAAEGDVHAPQFWVDAERLVFVRLLRPTGPAGESTQDIRFDAYRPLASAWISPLVLFLVDGVEVMREEYFDVEADVPLREGLFDPERWSLPDAR